MGIARFVRQMFGHWVSGMTGGLSLILAFAAFWLPTAPQKVGFAGTAMLCVVIAVYRIWRAAELRAGDLERRLDASRPHVIPEIVSHDGTLAIALTNVGGEPALGVAIEGLRSFDGLAQFDTIQVLKREDGRVIPSLRCPRMLDLARVFGAIHLSAVLTGRRNGRTETDFKIPLTIRYAGVNGHQFEDRAFCVSWIPSPTGAPIDTQTVIKRLAA